jgi:hypothetical protein
LHPNSLKLKGNFYDKPQIGCDQPISSLLITMFSDLNTQLLFLLPGQQFVIADFR